MSHNKRLLPGSLVTFKKQTESCCKGVFAICDMTTVKPEQLYIRSLHEPKRATLVWRRDVEPVPLELVVYLVQGPVLPGKRWEFSVHRPGGEVDCTFSWPWDTELNEETIVQEAWDEAECPDQVESIALSSSLKKLLATKTGA